MRTARFLGLLLALMLSALQPAAAQRVHFPTKLPLNTAIAPTAPVSVVATPRYAAGSPYGTVAQGTTTIAPPGTSVYGAPPYSPGLSTPAYTPPPGGSSPTYTLPPGGNMAAPGLSPTYTPPPAHSYPPGISPNYAPPTAAFQGTIQPPPTGWDPYATPGMQAPSLMPSDPFLPQAPMNPYQSTGNYVETMQRFLDELRLDYVWMPGNGHDELGISEVEATATFAIPFFQNPKSPLLITPGFGLNLWNCPPPPAGPPGTNPTFPNATYAAFLDSAWNPQLTPMLSGELGFRIGVYSDFRRLTNESIRYTGRGYFLLAFSPSVQVKGGVIYLDRRRIKMLPAGGIIWKPNSDMKLDILFPNPKLAWRLHRVGNVDWWVYLRGEYGGDSWTINAPGGGSTVETDYNDLRAAVGLEFDNPSHLSGLFEVGAAFEREIYQQGTATMRPNTTIFLRGGLTY